MNQEILFKTEVSTLLLIKEEAEKNLLAIQNTEDVITNKSNNLIQIIFPITVILSGYSINSISIDNFDWKFYLSISLILLFCLVVFQLYKNILPVKSAMIGTEPNQLVKSDMISGNAQKDERNILVNRVYNLQTAIEYTVQSHSTRYKRFRNTNKILLVGLVLIFSLFVLFQFFLLFQDKC